MLESAERQLVDSLVMFDLNASSSFEVIPRTGQRLMSSSDVESVIADLQG